MSKAHWDRCRPIVPTVGAVNDEPYIGRRPTDDVVREATRKYITADFVTNGKKYSPSDYERVRQYITATSPLNSAVR